MKRQPTEWEKIFANDATDRGLIFKIYKQLIQFSNKKTTQLKNCQKILIDSSPKKTYRQPIGNMKRCSTSLIIREKQIKSTRKYYLKPVRMAIIKNSTNSKFCRGCGEKANAPKLFVGMSTCALEKSMEVP